MSEPHDYANDTTAELIKCLQVGAAVMTVQKMVEYPEMMLACAQRMADLQAEVLVKTKKLMTPDEIEHPIPRLYPMPLPPGNRRGHEPSCEALYGDYNCTCQ